MKIGLTITTFNRYDYLKQTLDSLSQSYLPKELEIFIVDDKSTDSKVISLVRNFSIGSIKITKIFHEKNYGMAIGLREGITYFLAQNFDIMVNLDSDVLVKPYWLNILLKFHKLFPGQIITGFNNVSHNPILEKFASYNTKKVAGGINLLFGRELCESVVPCFSHGNQWDCRLWETMQKQKKPYIAVVPSVIQHLGTQGGVHPDGAVAEDYE